MEEKQKVKNAKGITLVALVVTIIVLIILAGVSISLVLGENGIITKSKYAKQATLNSQVAEQEQLNEAAEYLESLGGTKKPTGGGDTGGDTAVVGELVTGENKEYTKNGTAVIPVGFAIVPGLDDVSEGLVISDVANDTENTGNQFVWIPVDKATFASKFKRTEGYYDGELHSFRDCGEADGTGVNSKVTEDTTVTDEAKLMYASVEQNGGFYIGRYEAGTTATSGEGIRGNLVVKKGVNVYNRIDWSDSNDETDVTGGAVEVARGMYTGKKTANNENYGVISTLCYGVQWDAALNFIDPNYITNEVDGKPNCAEDSYLVDSTGKGWYDDNYSKGNPNHLTGIDVDSSASNKVKNIYDMAGNVYELTMEYSDKNSYGVRITRGGAFDDDGSEFTASSRYDEHQDYNISYLGFRVTLYVE